MCTAQKTDLSRSRVALNSENGPTGNCGDEGFLQSIDDSVNAAVLETHDRNGLDSLCRGQRDDINNLDAWLRRDVDAPRGSTAVPSSSVPVNQRATLATGISFIEIHGIGYWLTMIMPFLNIGNCYQPSSASRTVLNAAEIFSTQVLRLLREFNNQITRLGQEQIVRDVFATTMNIMLIIYAIGFLILSLYQASVISD